MRYIGSKQKLLGAIWALAEARGVAPGARALDVFSGTAVVGRMLKERGLSVATNDALSVSYALQRGHVVAEATPPNADALVAALQASPPVAGVIARQFSPLGPADRRYFRPEQAMAIDGAIAALRGMRRRRAVDEDGFYVLLAGLLEGASACANIAGTYGAYLKTWSSRTVHLPALALPAPIPSRGERCSARLGDAIAAAREIACDLMYVDPPYNRRDYSANYHVIEVLARLATSSPQEQARLEASLYGKTGLLPYERSAFCSPCRVEQAFRDLFAATSAEHVIVSYSEEGLLGREALVAALADGLGLAPTAVEVVEVAHKRFRSDRDRVGGAAAAPRSYKVLPGRERDAVHDWLVYARRERAVRPKAARRAAVRRKRPGQASLAESLSRAV